LINGKTVLDIIETCEGDNTIIFFEIDDSFIIIYSGGFKGGEE
jgi:hypothetical protein